MKKQTIKLILISLFVGIVFGVVFTCLMILAQSVGERIGMSAVKLANAQIHLEQFNSIRKKTRNGTTFMQLIEYIIIAFDANGGEITRSIITSSTVTTCHHQAKITGSEMLQKGADNVMFFMNGRTMGFMPDCDALPLDFWTESVNALPV